MKLLQDHIDEVMDEFDFGKVQKAMEFLGWEWVGAEEGVPTESELRKGVRRHMIDAYDKAYQQKRNYKVGTGGFSVEYFYEEDFFQVEFVLSQWSTEYFWDVPF